MASYEFIYPLYILFCETASVIKSPLHNTYMSLLDVGWITVFKATMSHNLLHDYQCMLVHISVCVFSQVNLAQSSSCEILPLAPGRCVAT